MRLEYYNIVGLENIYLEDSYLISLVVKSDEIVLTLEAVLTQNHHMYQPPMKNEQYCYRVIDIVFKDFISIKIKSEFTTNESIKDEYNDLANIYYLHKDADIFYLEFEKGEIEIKSTKNPVVLYRNI